MSRPVKHTKKPKTDEVEELKRIESIEDTFLYFAYGSNLLKQRIRINNPSAEYVGIGRLDRHQLGFIKYSRHWGGASGTIVPYENSHVWGAIWRVHIDDLHNLDWQEGVGDNWYFAKTVKVTTPHDQVVECRTYEQTVNPPPRREDDEKGERDDEDVEEEEEEIPDDYKPSITYWTCIIKGAEECRLPDYYIAKLKKIPHNGQLASPSMIAKLGFYY